MTENETQGKRERKCVYAREKAVYAVDLVKIFIPLFTYCLCCIHNKVSFAIQHTHTHICITFTAHRIERLDRVYNLKI